MQSADTICSRVSWSSINRTFFLLATPESAVICRDQIIPAGSGVVKNTVNRCQLHQCKTAANYETAKATLLTKLVSKGKDEDYRSDTLHFRQSDLLKKALPKKK